MSEKTVHEKEIEKLKEVNNNQYHELQRLRREQIRLADYTQNQINGLKEMQGILSARILRIEERLDNLEYTHKHKHECSEKCKP